MHVIEPGPMELVFYGEFVEVDPPRHVVMTVDDMSATPVQRATSTSRSTWSTWVAGPR